MRWLVVVGLLVGACRPVSPPVDPPAGHTSDEPAPARGGVTSETEPDPAPAPSRLQAVLTAARTEWETEPAVPAFEELYRRGHPGGIYWRETGRLDPFRRKLDQIPRSDPKFPDELHRLAQIALHQAEYGRHQMRFADGETEREQVRRVANHYAEHAVRALLELVDDDDFRGFKARDRALFDLAQAAVVLEDDDLQVRAYERLVLEHPKSQLVHLCHIGLGNVAYRQDRFDDALRSFDQVLASTPGQTQSYAEYRRAWTQLHRGNPAAAETRFLRTLELADRGIGPRESFVIALRASARLGLVRTMLDAEVADALARIEDLGTGPREREDARRRMQEDLALGLLATGRFAKALQAYDTMLAPDSARRCRLGSQWIASALGLGDAEAAAERLRRVENTALHHQQCAPALEPARALVEESRTLGRAPSAPPTDSGPT